jgi:hypothetical protein
VSIPSLIALMMEASRTPETLINFYQTTLRYNPEDSHFCNMYLHVVFNDANSDYMASDVWMITEKMNLE